jgi:hypothetical protein
MTKPFELGLLLAHADTREPIVSHSIQRDGTRGMTEPDDEKLSGSMYAAAADPNDLAQQHYAVLAPEGPRGDCLLSLVRPLLESRSAEQGGLPIYEARVPANLDAAGARKFRSSLLQEHAPRYWLVLGDLPEVSPETTFALATQAFVGRLGFSKDDHYAAYVEKVLRWEKSPSRATTGQTILCSVRDGTAATALVQRALMRPLEDAVTIERERKQFDKSNLLHLEPTSLSDLSSTFQTPEPTVIFSASHGAGPPREGYASLDEQERLSGAMCIGKDILTGEDIGQRPFLPGSIWFYFACYGAGTPAKSAFEPWLEALVKQGAMTKDAAHFATLGLSKQPFLGALPKAALANPNGPLAVLGHIDLAWSVSFADAGTRGERHTMRFLGAMRALVEGRRAGIAHGELTRFLLDTSHDLTEMYDQEKRGEAVLNDRSRDLRKAQLWLRRHDVGHYVLLGDPAVRLPLASNRVLRVEAGNSADLEVMEAAVLSVLGRGESPEQVAQRLRLNAHDVRRWASEYAAAGRERLRALIHPKN